MNQNASLQSKLVVPLTLRSAFSAALLASSSAYSVAASSSLMYTFLLLRPCPRWLGRGIGIEVDVVDKFAGEYCSTVCSSYMSSLPVNDSLNAVICSLYTPPCHCGNNEHLLCGVKRRVLCALVAVAGSDLTVCRCDCYCGVSVRASPPGP